MMTISGMEHVTMDTTWRLLFLLSLINAAPDTDSSNVCGPEWLDFNGHCYKLTTGRLDGTEELRYDYLTDLCRGDEAYPATLTRAVENDVARSLLTTTTTSDHDAAFIGLFRDSPSAEWLWHDGAPLIYNKLEIASTQKALVRTPQTATLTYSGHWQIVALSQAAQRNVTVLCEKEQPPTMATKCDPVILPTERNPSGQNSDCMTIRVKGSRYHPETSGKYQLHEGRTCDNNDIFDQDLGDNYISFHADQEFWMIGLRVCGGRYILSANDIRPDPTRVTTTWREWSEDDKKYVPNPNITVTCDVHANSVDTERRVNIYHSTIALSGIFGALCLVLTGVVIMLCKTRVPVPKRNEDLSSGSHSAPQELVTSTEQITGFAVSPAVEITAYGEKSGAEMSITPDRVHDVVCGARNDAYTSNSNKDHFENIYASLSEDEIDRSCYEDISEQTWPKTRMSAPRESP